MPVYTLTTRTSLSVPPETRLHTEAARAASTMSYGTHNTDITSGNHYNTRRGTMRKNDTTTNDTNDTNDTTTDTSPDKSAFELTPGLLTAIFFMSSVYAMWNYGALTFTADTWFDTVALISIASVAAAIIGAGYKFFRDALAEFNLYKKPTKR